MENKWKLTRKDTNLASTFNIYYWDKIRRFQASFQNGIRQCTCFSGVETPAIPSFAEVPSWESHAPGRKPFFRDQLETTQLRSKYEKVYGSGVFAGGSQKINCRSL